MMWGASNVEICDKRTYEIEELKGFYHLLLLTLVKVTFKKADKIF
jgi:hypothetical protein